MKHNSRPLSDKDIYDRYRDDEPLDEIGFETGIEFARGPLGREQDIRPMFWPSGCIEINAADTHHIFSVGGQRPDFRSNLISLARWAHDAFHFRSHGDQSPIRVLCLLSKIKKSARLNDPSEFSEAEIDIAAGCSVRGWVECCTFEPAWEWVKPYRAELLERLGAANSP